MSLVAWQQRVRRARRFARERGFKALIGRVMKVLLNPSSLNRALRAHSIHKQYWFVLGNPVGQDVPADDIPPNTINWFVPDVGRGSGGHLNIFRFISYLEELGFDCRIIAIGDLYPKLSPEELKKHIADWYLPLQAETFVGAGTAPPAAISFATAWQTAYIVRNFKPTLHRCYFVQDFEPWFSAAGAQSILAEETYRFGFTGITAGSWLAEKLSRDFGMTTHSVGFSYDRTLYSPPAQAARQFDAKRVFFYARPSTIRRGFELGVLVLSEVARRIPDVTIVMAGGSLDSFDIPFKYVDNDIVDLNKLPGLYGTCSVALVLSFTNLSLLPLELMACGVPVVSNRAPYTEWLLNDDNAKLVPATVEALADAICEVLQNRTEAQRLRDGGLKAARATDWAVEGYRMGQILAEVQGRPLPKSNRVEHG
jgi:glycosyltransferase involved in cell wall biosynthesis